MSTGITSAKDSFTNNALSNYPIQHVGNFSTTALKLIKIVQQGYALPVDLGYKLLFKVSDTSSDYFNLPIFA